MIKYPKINPVGVDIFTAMMQHLEQEELPTLFGVSESLCLFYGRGEFLTLNGKLTKVVFSSGREYDILGYDKNYAFISYLMIDGNFEPVGLLEKVNVSLYCHGDLTQLFPLIIHRADEELRKVMQDFVYRLIEPQNMRSTETIEEMQPFHSLKINFTI